MDKLTTTQAAILDFLTTFHAEAGFMPSTREIQARFGYASQTAAVNHLNALVRKGALVKGEGKARALVLANPPAAAVATNGTAFAATSGVWFA